MFTVLLLVAAVIFGTVSSPLFFSGLNLSFLMANVVEVALMALPVALLIITAEIDLSIASILGLASSLVGFLWNHNLPMELIIPLVLAAGALAGALNGFLVTRVGLPSLAVTIGTLALFRGLAYVILGDASVSDFPSGYLNFGQNSVAGNSIPETFLVFVVLAIAFGIMLHCTAFGRRVFAIGANQEAAFFSGIRVKRIKMLLFVLSGVVSALAGIVFTFRFGSAQAGNGTGFELSVLAAVLLGGVSIFGGRGSIIGVVCAIFVLGAITNALTLDNVSTQGQTIVIGGLLLLSALAPRIGVSALGLWRRRLARREGKRPPAASPAARYALATAHEAGEGTERPHI
jgi:rhamnose transport system permease protein